MQQLRAAAVNKTVMARAATPYRAAMAMPFRCPCHGLLSLYWSCSSYLGSTLTDKQSCPWRPQAYSSGCIF
eukprot:6185067-Pleurochrysis_carterae.AAC.4